MELWGYEITKKEVYKDGKKTVENGEEVIEAKKKHPKLRVLAFTGVVAATALLALKVIKDGSAGEVDLGDEFEAVAENVTDTVTDSDFTEI